MLSSAGGDGVEIPAKSVRLSIVFDTHTSFMDSPLQIENTIDRMIEMEAPRSFFGLTGGYIA